MRVVLKFTASFKSEFFFVQFMCWSVTFSASAVFALWPLPSLPLRRSGRDGSLCLRHRCRIVLVNAHSWLEMYLD